MHRFHTTKWRVPQSAHQCKSMDDNQGTMYGAEYWLQCIRNDGDCVGISKVCAKWVPQMLTQEKREHCMQGVFRTCWANRKLKMAVSWITLLLVIRHVVGTTNWNPAVHGAALCDFSIKVKVQGPGLVRWSDVHCLLDRKGVIFLDFLEPEQTINSHHYIMRLNKLKVSTSRVRSEKTSLLLQHDNAGPRTSLKAGAHCPSWLDCPATITVQARFGIFWLPSVWANEG